MHPVRSLRTRRSRIRGFALIEALVGILIFAFGILGLVGLQVAMTRAQGAAKFRADAAYLGSQIIGMMWADRPHLASYDSANCASYAPCNDWKSKVDSTLPNGLTDLSYTPATGIVNLTITWSTPVEGTHTHVVSSSIQ
jgi:type IV pilus assembly protein PilV